jgi:hypothetical protein
MFPRALNPIFWVHILKFFDADPGSEIQDGKKFGSGIRDGKNSDLTTKFNNEILSEKPINMPFERFYSKLQL